MVEQKKMTIKEFKKRYETNPKLFVELEKHGTLFFHSHCEDLQEILFCDFEILNDNVLFKEVVATVNQNPFFERYRQEDEEFKKLIDYNPNKKNTSIIEVKEN